MELGRTTVKFHSKFDVDLTRVYSYGVSVVVSYWTRKMKKPPLTLFTLGSTRAYLSWGAIWPPTRKSSNMSSGAETW